MIFLAIGLLVVSAVLYVITGDGNTVAGVQRDVFPRVAVPLSIFIFLMAAAARLTRGPLGETLRALGTWASIGLVAGVLYAYRAELGEAGQRVMTELRPDTVTTVNPGVGGRGAIVHIAKDGDHFVATAWVNGKRMPEPMIVDTGASRVVLTAEDARRAGIRTGMLEYKVQVMTANGPSRAAPIMLESVSIGGLTLRNVEALVTRRGTLHRSLLGMSFLSRLRSYEFTGNRLTLKS